MPPPPRLRPSAIGRPTEPPTGSSGTSRAARRLRLRVTEEIQARSASSNAIAPAPAIRARRRTRSVERSTTAAPARLPASVSTARVPSGVIASARAAPGSRTAATGRSVAASMTSSTRPRVA